MKLTSTMKGSVQARISAGMTVLALILCAGCQQGTSTTSSASAPPTVPVSVSQTQSPTTAPHALEWWEPRTFEQMVHSWKMVQVKDALGIRSFYKFRFKDTANGRMYTCVFPTELGNGMQDIYRWQMDFENYTLPNKYDRPYCEESPIAASEPLVASNISPADVMGSGSYQAFVGMPNEHSLPSNQQLEAEAKIKVVYKMGWPEEEIMGEALSADSPRRGSLASASSMYAEADSAAEWLSKNGNTEGQSFAEKYKKDRVVNKGYTMQNQLYRQGITPAELYSPGLSK